MTALVHKPKNPHYYLTTEQDREQGTITMWLGPVVKRFGLTDVEDRHVLNLWNHREPHGGKLLVEKFPGRVSAWELGLNFHGSMKVLRFAPKGMRKTLDGCEMDAYKEMATLIQERCGWTRTGHGGAKKERAEIPMLLKRELFSRWAGSPQPHAHLILFATVFAADGKPRSLHASPLFDEQRVIGAALNLEYANLLSKRAGLRVVRKGNHAALPGRFENLLRELSPASETIKRHMKENGFHSPKAATILAQKLKPAKVSQSLPDLQATWEEVAARHGFSWERLERRRPVKEFAQSIASPKFRAIKHAENTLTHLTRRNPQVTERDLLEEALLSAIGKNLSLRQVLDGVQYIVRSKQIHSLGQAKDSPVFTTKEVWKSERRTLGHAEALAKKDRLLVTSDPARAAPNYTAWCRHWKVVRPDNIDTLLGSFDKGPKLTAHWEAFRTACKSGGGIQARLKAAEQAYREARKPVSKPEAKTVYQVEDLDRIPTASLERLLNHARRCGAKVILREPSDLALKAVSGILPQLLDLNRAVVSRTPQERRPTVDHEMRFSR